MRLTVDEWALQLAVVTAQRSTCLRRHVGCVLLDEHNHVLSTGYNGVASGAMHCNEYIPDLHVYPFACAGAKAKSGTDLDACEAIHAEQNALLQCRDVHALVTAYVTTSPCVTCVKLLLNTGCQRIVFLDEYPHEAAKRLWVTNGRVWKQVDTSPLGDKAEDALWFVAPRLFAAVDERDALRKRVAELEELYGWLRGDVPSHSLRWPRWKIERWSGKWWEEIRGDAMDAAIKADKEGLLK